MKNQDKRDLLNATKGKYFTVIFTKKDGSERKLNGRLGVKKHLRGGSSTTSHLDNLITVFEKGSTGYRNINLDKLISFSFKGETTTF